MLTEHYPEHAAQNIAGINLARRSSNFAPEDVRPVCRSCPSAGNCDPSMDAILDEVQDGLSRAVQLNVDLQLHRVNTGPADELVCTGICQVAGLRNYLAYQMSDESSVLPHDLGETVSLLRHTYRRILIREDLPPATAREVLSVAQYFDKTAGSMGFY